MKRTHHASRLLGLSCAASVLSIAGCNPVETDRAEDGLPGSVPEPAGQIDGTVLYVGQRPTCDRDEEGALLEVNGRVILLAFLSNNPPPPQGTASAASTLLIIPARDLFPLTDCLPEEPTAEDLTTVVTRSVGFTWPDVPLARAGVHQCDGDNPDRRGDCIDYQVRAFFDRDEDFNPFFSVRRLATRGDVAGGAFVNTAANPPQFARIPFGGVANRPNGQRIGGVAVTLGAIVNTELPAYELGDETTALSSEDVIPAVTDSVMRETMLWEQARMSIELIDPLEGSWVTTLAAAGMNINPDPSGYGWFVFPVDANRDGAQDLHPILGPSAGVQWEHPIVILRRARNPVELALGIPDAVIIASVRPSQTLTKDTFFPSIDIVAPPIGAVTLDPNNPSCRIPYIAPGALAETYERIPADCQEVPTGNYDVNVLTGIAGGRAIDYRQQLTDMGLPETVVNSLAGARTESDWVIEGGSFSSQAWSIPNELGCPDPYARPGTNLSVTQVDVDPTANCGTDRLSCDLPDGSAMQCSQGPHGRFAVVDPDSTNSPDTEDNTPGHGIAECQTAVSSATGTERAVVYMDVPEECCAPIAHFCGLPLCPLRDEAVLEGRGGSRAIREVQIEGTDYGMNADGTLYANCVPFLMPASCCD
jgi:hypothetical protein